MFLKLYIFQNKNIYSRGRESFKRSKNSKTSLKAQINKETDLKFKFRKNFMKFD